MTIQERLASSQQRFDQEKLLRNEQLAISKDAEARAEEHFLEMTKLQGEYRLLQEMLADEATIDPEKVNKQATVIEAVPEKVE